MELSKAVKDIAEWNYKAGHATGNLITDWYEDGGAARAYLLVEEEVAELMEAVEEDTADGGSYWVAGTEKFADNSVEILDAAADIFFTLIGLLTKAGLEEHFEPALKEVMRSNDTKLIEPIYGENNKVGKNPKYYEPPNILKAIGREG